MNTNNPDNSGNKYRPTFTEAQIDALLEALASNTFCKASNYDLANAANILSKLSKKIKADCVSASYSLKAKASLEDSLGMGAGSSFLLTKRKLAAIQYILNQDTCSPNTCELASDFVTGNPDLFPTSLVEAIWAQDDYLYSARNEVANLFGTELERANLVARIHTHAI